MKIIIFSFLFSISFIIRLAWVDADYKSNLVKSSFGNKTFCKTF